MRRLKGGEQVLAKMYSMETGGQEGYVDKTSREKIIKEARMRQEKIIDAARLRTHEGSFAFIPHRFLRAGFYSCCTPVELVVYLQLVLAADRWGMSFYGRETVSKLTRLSLERIEAAFQSLAAKDLIICDGTLTQVLSLPSEPVKGVARPKAPEVKKEEEEFDVSKAIRDFLGKKGWDK